jgi:uncharacterized protein (DUF433 family)
MLRVEPFQPDVFGRGVYSPYDSVRLANFRLEANSSSSSLTSRTLSRWLQGYNIKSDGDIRYSPPLWELDYANDDGLELSFRDLIELKFVKAFRDIGLSLPAIRKCLLRAADIVGDARPFSTQKFRSDGKTIFLDITNSVDEGQLVDLKRRQNVFRSVVAPIFHNIEFDAKTAVRWFPLGMKRSIVVDPARSFGQPILMESGVPAEVIACAVPVEGSAERVAQLFEISLKSVHDAILFQSKLAA